jgi:hypothetical protein
VKQTQKLEEKCPFARLLPFSTGESLGRGFQILRQYLEPKGRLAGHIRGREGSKALEKARPVWRRGGGYQLVDPKRLMPSSQPTSSTALFVMRPGYRLRRSRIASRRLQASVQTALSSGETSDIAN